VSRDKWDYRELECPNLRVSSTPVSAQAIRAAVASAVDPLRSFLHSPVRAENTRKRAQALRAERARTGRSSDRLSCVPSCRDLAANADDAIASDDKRPPLHLPHQETERMTFHVFRQIDVRLQDVDQWSHEG
jgi:hypothetical protein